MRITCHILLSVLACCLLSCSGGADARRQLEGLEARNRSGEAMLNDTLAETLAAYFDRHGTANERMRARYMLGRTYYDLGELPRALETYYGAADCADTTAADCDYKVLSRIHAQSAEVFHKQVQPRSELKELRLAEYYALKGKDTLMAINCFELKSTAYDFLHLPDSVIYVAETAAKRFYEISREDRYAQTLGVAIDPLLKKGNTNKAKSFLNVYEKSSGFFNQDHEISSGREIYYYVKGRYYLAINQVDSAEYMFRKELRDGKDLNNQIAGSKGLQEVYTKRGISDSIAKYASIGYELNDSAYSLAEMENIQKLQASYNYNHHKQLAQRKELEANHAYLLIAIFIGLTVIVGLAVAIAFLRYKHRKDKETMQYHRDLELLEMKQTEVALLQSENEDYTELIAQQKQSIVELQGRIEAYQQKKLRHDNNLEATLANADIIVRLHEKASSNPSQIATSIDLRRLKMLLNEQIPVFYGIFNNNRVTLRPIEYELCMLVRCRFNSADISRLLGCSDSYVANLKKGIFLKIFGTKGTPKEFDQKVLAIK